ncbi:MAG: glycoside hydrolase family 99-like domain-containing protein [Hyphomicrobiales bacterium]|nr:glycoside hydrolase family 99-like domain-containing protein [Hyphomicrobiales bacterium]
MNVFIRQYEHNTSIGPAYEPASNLPDGPAADAPVRYIAYYLPQFHETPENNEWWGNGFTEWTNVTKALPRYLGHYQPRLPGDFGFYDLSNPDYIRRQVALAKRGGIYGFCIHNYWFSGRRLLEGPLRAILQNRDIDIPFCLNWANESWSRRWDGSEQSILVKQNYAPGEDIQYAEYVLEFVADDRYIKIDGRPLIMLYRPDHLPDARATIERWREVFLRRGFPDPYIIMPQSRGVDDPRPFGIDAAAGFPPHKVAWENVPDIRHWVRLLDPRFVGRVVSYDDVAATAIANRPNEFRLFPGVCPHWDNEARRPGSGFSLAGSTPNKYAEWLRAASEYALKAPRSDERLVFVNAWNEWAEGAYLEPDRHNGCAYLAATRRVLESLRSSNASRSLSAMNDQVHSPLEITRTSITNFAGNFPRVAMRKLRRRISALAPSAFTRRPKRLVKSGATNF